MIRFCLYVLLLSAVFSCRPVAILPTTPLPSRTEPVPSRKLVIGAEQLPVMLPQLAGKRVGLVVNHTSFIGKAHLADSLKSLGINIVRIFGPEHGFRGNAADGEIVNDSVDVKTGIPIVSLYGKTKKPTSKQLADIDIMIFDIQDVGTRFYTYIGTMHYVMEACAENKKKLIILDRPNPNAYVDGSMNEKPLQSFVAMHAIPIAHGMTVGELALMINGEGWLTDKIKCDIEIIKLINWKHNDGYLLPIGPSPNLPNNQAIQLYPSLCLFEGTVISLGRGTPFPFQALGSPELKNMSFQFTPITIKGIAVNPPQENKLCYGIDLRNVIVEKRIDLKYLLTIYNAYPNKEKFFTSYFDILAGTSVLKQQIKDGLTEEQIRASWKPELDAFKIKREKYLLYQ